MHVGDNLFLWKAIEIEFSWEDEEFKGGRLSTLTHSRTRLLLRNESGLHFTIQCKVILKPRQVSVAIYVLFSELPQLHYRIWGLIFFRIGACELQFYRFGLDWFVELAVVLGLVKWHSCFEEILD